MKSPFPGMDPYLEQHWEDVHTRLISYVADALQPQLSDDLVARMEEKVYIEDLAERRRRKPDVAVIETPVPWRPGPPSGDLAAAVLDEPMEMELAGDPIRHRSVQIHDLSGNRVVTAIEILSPWNKMPGRGLEEYLVKRDEYVRSDVNLVEIDLVRTGDWTEMTGPYRAPKRGNTTYRATVSIPKERPRHYAISMRAKLPTVRVPLRPQDAPALLDLQSLIEKAYEMGRYDRIDYAAPCAPPLTAKEQEWVAEVLRAAGRA
jgi:hypothetical protein